MCAPAASLRRSAPNFLPLHQLHQDMSTPNVVMLPNKAEALGFRRLVFDRQRAFMAMELIQLREGLFSSDALIALAQENNNRLDKVLTRDDHRLGCAFEPFFRFVTHTAWGDSVLRWTGQLPAVRAFAPGESLEKPGRSRTTETSDPIIEALKSAPRSSPDKFYDYYETQRLTGRLAGSPSARCKSKEELRQFLQPGLDAYNSMFIGFMHLLLYEIDYPYQNMDMLSDKEQDFRHFVEAVEPLPSSLLEGLDNGDPSTYSLDQLNEMRKRGQAVREKMARVHREAGNAHWARAATLTNERDKQTAKVAAKKE